MTDDLRHRYAEAIRKAADYPIVAEWICCDPVKPDHDLCVKGDIARQMLRAVLADDPEMLFLPSGVADAVMAVRDEELQAWQERAETAEAKNDRARALHPSAEEAQATQNALCLECCTPAPCATRQALDAAPDDTAGTENGTASALEEETGGA